MKKIINFKYTFLGAIMLLSAISCTDDDQSYPDPNKPIATVDTNSITINEGESATVTLTLDKVIGDEIDYKIEVVGGDATDGDDFQIVADDDYPEFDLGPAGYRLTIPAGASSRTFQINGLNDIYVDGSESVRLKITSAGNGNGLLENGEEFITVNLNNQTSQDFYVGLAWSGTYVDADGDEHDFCDFDLDLEIYTDVFGLVATSYSSCPEEITVPANALADGNYYLVPSFYDNDTGVAPATNVQIPATITFAKPGIDVAQIDISDVWDYETGGFEQGNPDAYLVRYLLNISGTTYTVTDLETNQVVFQN